jgi:hypothetical protein
MVSTACQIAFSHSVFVFLTTKWLHPWSAPTDFVFIMDRHYVLCEEETEFLHVSCMELSPHRVHFHLRLYTLRFHFYHRSRVVQNNSDRHLHSSRWRNDYTYKMANVAYVKHGSSYPECSRIIQPLSSPFLLHVHRTSKLNTGMFTRGDNCTLCASALFTLGFCVWMVV